MKKRVCLSLQKCAPRSISRPPFKPILRDSVGYQFAKHIELLLRFGNSNSKATLPAPHTIEKGKGTGKGDNVCVTAPLNPFQNSSGGSGALAFWRAISMFRGEYLNWAPPNWNKGWKLESAQTLREFVSNGTSTQNKSQGTATTRNIKSFCRHNKKRNHPVR